MASTQSASLCGAPLQQRAAPRVARRAAMQPVKALFGRKQSGVAVAEPPAAPAKKQGFFTIRPRTAAEPATAKKPAQKQQPAVKKVAKQQPAKQQKAASKSIDKAAEYEKRQGLFGRTLSAFDFAEVRSKSDAELLYEAKYGQRGEDGKMSREQYMALRRRVGGTAKDYWKGWVDVKGEYVEKGYVAKDASATAASVPALPFLVAVVVAMLGATAVVVQQTS